MFKDNISLICLLSFWHITATWQNSQYTMRHRLYTFMLPPSLWNMTWRSINRRLLNTHTFSPSSLDFDQLTSQAHIKIDVASIAPCYQTEMEFPLAGAFCPSKGKLHQLLNTHTHLKEGPQSPLALHGLKLKLKNECQRCSASAANV